MSDENPIVKRTNFKHGGWIGNKPSPEWNSWGAMMARCYTKSNIAYDRYGGAGITVCDRWHDFKNFLEDMGKRPSKSHTLERIDNKGNYEPSNCRWATKREQAQNRRNNRFITINGETKCISEWARINSIRPGTILERLKTGWSELEAVTRKPNLANKHIRKST